MGEFPHPQLLLPHINDFRCLAATSPHQSERIRGFVTKETIPLSPEMPLTSHLAFAKIRGDGQISSFEELLFEPRPLAINGRRGPARQALSSHSRDRGPYCHCRLPSSVRIPTRH